MCETLSKMHMHDVVEIDTIVFEIEGAQDRGWAGF